MFRFIGTKAQYTTLELNTLKDAPVCLRLKMIGSEKLVVALVFVFVVVTKWNAEETEVNFTRITVLKEEKLRQAAY